MVREVDDADGRLREPDNEEVVGVGEEADAGDEDGLMFFFFRERGLSERARERDGDDEVSDALSTFCFFRRASFNWIAACFDPHFLLIPISRGNREMFKVSRHCNYESSSAEGALRRCGCHRLSHQKKGRGGFPFKKRPEHFTPICPFLADLFLFFLP